MKVSNKLIENYESVLKVDTWLCNKSRRSSNKTSATRMDGVISATRRRDADAT